MVQNQPKISKKLFLSLKYLILLTFKVKNQKKTLRFFSDFPHGITNYQKILFSCIEESVKFITYKTFVQVPLDILFYIYLFTYIFMWLFDNLKVYSDNKFSYQVDYSRKHSEITKCCTENISSVVKVSSCSYQMTV